jgi:hypothetical protein
VIRDLIRPTSTPGHLSFQALIHFSRRVSITGHFAELANRHLILKQQPDQERKTHELDSDSRRYGDDWQRSVLCERASFELLTSIERDDLCERSSRNLTSAYYSF